MWRHPYINDLGGKSSQMRMVSSTLPMSMIDVCLTVKRIECNSQKGARRGHSTKLVVRYFVYYYTIWWTITDTGACVPRTKISSWPFTYAFTCYSNPLNVKCIICLFICRVSKPIFIYWMYAVVKNVSTRAVVPVPPWLDVRKGRNTFYVIKCCILGENR